MTLSFVIGKIKKVAWCKDALQGLAIIVYLLPLFFLVASYLHISLNIVLFISGFVSLCMRICSSNSAFLYSIPILALGSVVYVVETWGAGALVGGALASIVGAGGTFFVVSLLKTTQVFRFFSPLVFSVFYIAMGMSLALLGIPLFCGFLGADWSFPVLSASWMPFSVFVFLAIIAFLFFTPRRFALFAPLFAFLLGSLFVSYWENSMQTASVFSQYTGNSFLGMQILQDAWQHIADFSFVLPAFEWGAVLIMGVVGAFTVLEQYMLAALDTQQTNARFSVVTEKTYFLPLLGASLLCAPLGIPMLGRSTEMRALAGLGCGFSRRALGSAVIFLLLFALCPFTEKLIMAFPVEFLQVGLLFIAGSIVCMGVRIIPASLSISLFSLILAISFFATFFLNIVFFPTVHVHALWLFLLPALFLQRFWGSKRV